MSIEEIKERLDVATPDKLSIQYREDIQTLLSSLEREKERADKLEYNQWYLHPESDTKNPPYYGKGLTWIQYAQMEFKRANKAEEKGKLLQEHADKLGEIITEQNKKRLELEAEKDSETRWAKEYFDKWKVAEVRIKELEVEIESYESEPILSQYND